MTTDYLLFQLCGRVFGVRLAGAVEIVPWRHGRRVPLAYSYVEGLMEYRGAIYPVFNVAQRLGLKPPGPIGFTAEAEAIRPNQQSIILLDLDKRPLGITVDNVLKMNRFDELAPASAQTQGVDARFVQGLAYLDGREIIILDFERLFFDGG
jgi:chemotaxis signal transduction protein